MSVFLILSHPTAHKRCIVVAYTFVLVTVKVEWLISPSIESDIGLSVEEKKEQTHLTKLKITVGLTSLYKN